MKHKKLLIVLAVVLVMAVAAAVAYAWWDSTTTTTGNEISTSGINLQSDLQPIVAAGLMPQVAPDADTAEDDAYGAVSYHWVYNDSSAPLMFYGWLDEAILDPADSTVINPYVRVRIWLLGATSAPANWTTFPGWTSTFQDPGPWPSFDGTLAQLWSGAAGGRNYLSSRWWGPTATPSWHQTPIGPGEQGVYRVAIWLDSSAPNSTQNKEVGFSFKWTGMQVAAWDEALYDAIDFDPDYPN